jgi:UDP-N-acetylmuramate dehydrogenase
MDTKQLEMLKNKFGEKIQTDKKFSELTTLEIGGPVAAFLEANTQEDLIEAVQFAKQNQIHYLLIGGGSNLLVSDEGFDGLVIKVASHGISQEGPNLIVQSGTILQDLVNFAIENGLGGFNKLTGIPGTVGGAVYGDAGAYGHSIRDHLFQVKAFDGEKIVTFSKEDCQFGYRDSIFKQNKFLILEAEFKNLLSDDPQKMKLEEKEVLAKRQIKYPPGLKCPGSFFKNVISAELSPETLEKTKPYLTTFGKIPAGALVEAVGGKDDQLGQIKIAGNHGNTFINLGGGNANDFYSLAEKYYQKIKERFGVELKPEVQLINLPSFS